MPHKTALLFVAAALYATASSAAPYTGMCTATSEEGRKLFDGGCTVAKSTAGAETTYRIEPYNRAALSLVTAPGVCTVTTAVDVRACTHEAGIASRPDGIGYRIEGGATLEFTLKD